MPKNTIGLLRTNPKLSSNAKLIVDSNQNLYISSFRSNATLSKERYQKWAVNGERDWSTDLSIFFSDVKKEERYEILQKYSSVSVLNDFKYQYEDQYQYGARFNDSKLYEEQYRFLAPIWIDKEIPSSFIIYRVDDVDYPSKNFLSPQGVKSQVPRELNQNEKVLDLLSKATIVKVFDMKRGSNLGEYLHRHVTNDSFPYSPISFNFQADRGWSFNGIDIINGGFVSKREYKSEEYITPQNLEIYSNRFITNGFERYGIVSSNLINLEFLFDDPNADDYTVYRYFGLYANPIYEGSFELDSIQNSVFIPNLDSINTVYNTWNQAEMLPTYEFTKEGGELPTINWIQDKNLDYYHLQNNINGDFKIALNKKGIDEFSGKGKTGRRIKILENQNDLTNFLELKFEYAPNDWDRFFISIKSELKNGEARVNDFFILADPTLPAGSISENRFSNQGTLRQITQAFASIISNNDNPFTFKTKIIDNGLGIIVYDYKTGFNQNGAVFGISTSNYNNFSDSDGCLIIMQGDEYVDDFPVSAESSGYRMYSMIGGSSGKKHILIENEEIENIKIGEYIKFLGREIYAKVVKIIKNPDERYWRILLDRDYEIKRLEIDVFEDFKVKWGKWDCYDLNDFNFDFYDDSNSKLGELSYELPLINYQKLIPILEPDDPDREFQMVEVKSEYDRLFENEITETAILSRIVPWILKFRMKNTSNARNLPYILNTNEAFGESNLSPVINNISGRDPIYFNMEYFHIFDVPRYLQDKNIQSYLNFDNTTDNLFDILKNINKDQFELYFYRTGQVRPNESGTSNEWIDNQNRIMYSQFDFGSIAAYPYTIFRGLRYVYKQRKENINQGPIDFIQNGNINGYKFGTLARVIEVEKTAGLSRIKVVKNDKWKFICVYIEIEIPSTNQSLEKKYDRNWFYTANDLSDGSNTPFDVRFNWNSVNFNIGDYDDTLDAVVINGNNPRFTQTIIKNQVGTYYPILIEWDDNLYRITPTEIISDTRIKIAGAPIKISGTGPSVLLDTSIIPSNTLYYIEDKGVGRLSSILENITVNRFSTRFNQFEDIEYVTILENGDIVADEFILEIQDGTPFNKVSNLTHRSDSNRPAAYQLASGEIGKQIVDYKNSYVRVLKRMNGEYEPLFREVVTFTDIYNEQKKFDFDEYILDQDGYIDSGYIIKYFDWITDPLRRALIYQKFKYTGISFASHKQPYLDEYGFINNYFYHKVNERTAYNVLKLNELSDKLPLYPKIGEIAIDKKRLNVFDSKWSKDYFTRSLRGSVFEKANGTLSPVENSSFLASTIIKVKDEYTLSKWSISQEADLLSLDVIRFLKNKNGVHWAMDNKQIWADFYIDHILFENIGELMLPFFNSKIDTLNSFGKKDTLIDDIEIYVKENVVPRFIIDNIDVYVYESTSVQSEFISSNSIDINQGFKKINATIESFSNRKLGFRLIYNKREGYNYQFQIFIKIKA